MPKPISSVRTTGRLLPVDLLTQLANGAPELSASDYGLEDGETQNAAAATAWTKCKDAWTVFRSRFAELPQTNPGTAVTRKTWLLPLLKQLGYGRLLPRKASASNGQVCRVSHCWEEQVPVHLLSARYSLDGRTPGVPGAAASSPYSLLQEELNGGQWVRWGLLSNGRILYLLRNNTALRRPANVRFDLEAMFNDERQADFRLLYLLCHRSRLEILSDSGPDDCWLDHWSNLDANRSNQMREQLRQDVAAAIESLGAGFLRSSDRLLRRKLAIGQLSPQDYYRQLLRLVYRLLLLLVAEETQAENGQNLLHPSDTPDSLRERYARRHAVGRIRSLARTQPGTGDSDLYVSLLRLFRKLQRGDSSLALPAMGSFLFADEATPDLNHAILSDKELLAAFRCLDESLDFGHLTSEDLGGVYEGLLELHPEIDGRAGQFTLGTAAGHERKTSGSYYTPHALIECLLDSALDPVAEKAIHTAQQMATRPWAKVDARFQNAFANFAQVPATDSRLPDLATAWDMTAVPLRQSVLAGHALLAIRICDPACGSGHFLLAAADRMAMHLARVRTGDQQPCPSEVQQAKREVIGRCLYGVDINPMAVELCKASLWREAREPGRSLAFFDHRIQCGNSLIGASPELLAQGIPAAAFKPLPGDDKQVCAEIKKKNQQERIACRTRSEPLEKALHHRDPVPSRLVADTWCAIFLWQKTATKLGRLCPTEQTFRDLSSQGGRLSPSVRKEVERLRDAFQFFHWYLAFPEIFPLPPPPDRETQEELATGKGFDIVLGNPPWEHTELKEQEWFARHHPGIAAASGAKRKEKIEVLVSQNPGLHARFTADQRTHEGWSHFVRGSSRYPLAARGRTNTYGIFAELSLSLLKPGGRLGCIVPTGIATDNTYKFFFQYLTEQKRLVSLYDFENRDAIFPGVHRSYKFCLLTATGESSHTEPASFVFFAQSVADLRDSQRRFPLTASDIARLNPNSRTCPVFRSAQDAELSKAMFSRNIILANPAIQQRKDQVWDVTFKQGVYNMTSDSALLQTTEEVVQSGESLSAYGRLYEGRLGHQYQHRFASQDGSQITEVPASLLLDPGFSVRTQHLAPLTETARRLARRKKDCDSALLGFRRVARSTDERTAIAALLPWGAASYGWILTFGPPARELAALLAAYNSFVLDYCLRNSLSQPSIPVGVFEQLIVPARDRVLAHMDWLLPRVLELTYTAWDMQPFARDCGYDGPPFRWDEARRFQIRCELDAAFFHLYLGDDESVGQLSPRAAVEHILDTFPIVRRRDEARHRGDYRTKRVILESYDQLTFALRRGMPYPSRLNPPPGPPVDDQGRFLPGANLPAAIDTSHIHRPSDPAS
ncbi:Eco57I restriction-modification methylase domain-containing protein [Lignipirellula cremea]|uniref:site-specific DNA-methyltransferase (adenine-specific) n=1 Tax=Lignipirellula cremea TaxID=2528010 RepID=A0A518DSX9_9BACT|nr:SAM-dependent DNA methyltransferase [Lignipirellula cremea]QDU94946.1 N-6 DNA Methylase [Lignipirellula cremea]